MATQGDLMDAFPKSGFRIVSFMVLAFAAAGCSNSIGVDPSSPGYKDLSAHDYSAARDAFAAADAKDPHDPFVELNLAAAYQNLGRMDLAEPLYRSVLTEGKGVQTAQTTNPSDAGKTLAQIACTNLHLGLGDQAGC